MTIVVQSGVLRAAFDITTGLKVNWQFTSDATDSSGNGHDLTLSGGAAVTSNVLRLAAADTDTAQVSDHADFNFGTAMTAFGWVKAATAADTFLIGQYDFGTPGSRCWTMLDDGLGKMTVVVVDTASQATRKKYTSSLTAFDNTTNSVAFTWGSGTLKLYVDGALDPSPTLVQDDSFTTLANSTAALALGFCFGDGILVAGTGKVADMSKWRLYNVAKTATDIAALHAIGP